MRIGPTLLLLATSWLCGFLAACSATSETVGPLRSPAADRIPHTTNLRIRLGDEIVGYGLRYDPVPLEDRDRVDRPYPTGTLLIQNARLEPAGFVTPQGGAYRLTSGASQGVVFSHFLGNGDDLDRLAGRILGLASAPTIEPLAD